MREAYVYDPVSCRLAWPQLWHALISTYEMKKKLGKSAARSLARLTLAYSATTLKKPSVDREFLSSKHFLFLVNNNNDDTGSATELFS